MDMISYAMGVKAAGGGGGSDIRVRALNVTENGTYTAPSGTAYGTVSVDVSSGGSGIEVQELEITANGTYTAPSGVAYSPVTVSVPSSGGMTRLEVIIDSGSTVTAVNKDTGESYSGTEEVLLSDGAVYSVMVPLIPTNTSVTYTVTASKDTSTTTKDFTFSNSCLALSYSVLPYGYTELVYIESSGTQYINTGLTLPYGFRYEGDIAVAAEMAEGDEGLLFGSYDDAQRCFVGYRGTDHNWAIGVGAELYGGAWVKDTIYSMLPRTFIGSVQFIVDGTALSLKGGNVSDERNALTHYMFCMNHSGTPESFASVRMYGPQTIYSGPWNKVTLAGKFYPCKRNKDGAVGMYDTKRGVFYENAGTGSFIAGPEGIYGVNG